MTITRFVSCKIDRDISLRDGALSNYQQGNRDQLPSKRLKAKIRVKIHDDTNKELNKEILDSKVIEFSMHPNAVKLALRQT